MNNDNAIKNNDEIITISKKDLEDIIVKGISQFSIKANSTFLETEHNRTICFTDIMSNI